MKLILAFFLISNSIYCQSLTGRETRKIESFGVSLDQLKLENEQIFDDLNFILKKEKIRKKKKVAGLILASLSILSITGGILIATQSDKEPDNVHLNEAAAYRGLIGSFFIATGVIEGGISIPIFISSKRKKKERDEAIKIFNGKWNE